MSNVKRMRGLTEREIELARLIFGNTVEYNKVTIFHGRKTKLQPENGGMCTANTINISGRAYKADYAENNNADYLKPFFIHEMTHIWQYQKSPLYIGTKFAKEFLKHKFNYMAKAYQYNLYEHQSFDKYGIEQQACIVQDYFALRFNANHGHSGNCETPNISDKNRLKIMHNLLAPHFPNIEKTKRPPEQKKRPKT